MKILQPSYGSIIIQGNAFGIRARPEDDFLKPPLASDSKHIVQAQPGQMILSARVRCLLNYLSNRLFLLYLTAIETFYIVYQ
jgi:hypothetical protein